MTRPFLAAVMLLGLALASACSNRADATDHGNGNGNAGTGSGGNGNGSAGSNGDPDSGSNDGADAALDCGANSKACNEQCVALDDPATGCAGSSCLPCFYPNATAACAPSGACELAACEEGYQDCDGNSANGCEAHPEDDEDNCQVCGNICSFAHGQGDCLPDTGCTLLICDPGWGDCDGQAGDAGTDAGDSNDDAGALPSGDDCETDITTLTNCGGCGVACSVGDQCIHDDIAGGYQCVPP